MATNYTPIRTSPTAQGENAGKEYTDKYDVSQFTYPSDLFGAPERYGNSWAMININVLNTSAKADAYRVVDISDWERKLYTELDDRAKQGAGDATDAKVIASGVALAGGITEFLRSGGGNGIKDVVNSVITGIRSGGVAAFALTPILGGNVRTTKRISHAIQLPMPNELITNYSMQWGDESTKLLDLAMRASTLGSPATFDAIKSAFTGDFSAFKEAGGQAADAFYSASLGAQSFLGGGGVSSATGLASNPKKEQIFNGVNFRNFTLNYTFYPKSEQEATNVWYILYLMKYHMHPEFKTAGRFTYIYPSEFDITFFAKDGKENTWVSRIATCVLVDMSVNYTPNGLWAGHTSNNQNLDLSGFPNMIQAQMTFRELSLLTKETIEKGF